MLAYVFVFLSKLLPLFVFPLGLAVILLFIALVWRRLRVVFIILAIVVLWVGSSRYVAYALLRSLESRYPALTNAPQLDAIVVLGGGTRTLEAPRPMSEINEAGDRLLYAARLYHDEAADIVLVTGGSIEWLSPEDSGPEANDMQVILEMLGVPRDAIWVESEARNTYENAFYSREMLANAGLTDILLVTSAMHMPRSAPLFEQQGLRVTPAPTDYLVSDAEWRHLWQGGLSVTVINLLPNVEYLTYTTRALKEYIGLFVYGLRGWL